MVFFRSTISLVLAAMVPFGTFGGTLCAATARCQMPAVHAAAGDACCESATGVRPGHIPPVAAVTGSHHVPNVPANGDQPCAGNPLTGTVATCCCVGTPAI